MFGMSFPESKPQALSACFLFGGPLIVDFFWGPKNLQFMPACSDVCLPRTTDVLQHTSALVETLQFQMGADFIEQCSVVLGMAFFLKGQLATARIPEMATRHNS